METSFEVLEDDIRNLIAEARQYTDGKKEHTVGLMGYSTAHDAIGFSLKLLHDYRIQASMLNSRKEKEYHMQIISSLQNDIDTIRKAIEPNPNQPLSFLPKRSAGKSRVMTQDIKDMQEKSLAALKRCEQVIHCTEELGAEASSRLRQQRDKFYEIDQGLETIGTQIQRARREMNAFVRRMMRDKVIVFFSLLIFVALVIALSLKYRKRRQA